MLCLRQSLTKSLMTTSPSNLSFDYSLLTPASRPPMSDSDWAYPSHEKYIFIILKLKEASPRYVLSAALVCSYPISSLDHIISWDRLQKIVYLNDEPEEYVFSNHQIFLFFNSSPAFISSSASLASECFLRLNFSMSCFFFWLSVPI